MPIRVHADRRHSTQAWHGMAWHGIAQCAVEVVIDAVRCECPIWSREAFVL